MLRLNKIAYSLINKNYYNVSEIKNIVQNLQNQIVWDFSLFASLRSHIDCVMVQNNSEMNFTWLEKALKQTQNILLADGGANIFFQSGFHQYDNKIKGIIGDLDSLQESVKLFYQQKNIPILLIHDQNKNDFQKTLIHAITMGCKHIFVFGAIGGRFDHTLATMSISERFMKQYPQINITLTGKTTLMCLLRTGLKHRIVLSSDICRKGCGLVSFGKTENIETTGLKWNMGKQQQFNSIEWGSFISSSNEIVADQITVQSSKQDSIINLVVNIKSIV